MGELLPPKANVSPLHYHLVQTQRSGATESQRVGDGTYVLGAIITLVLLGILFLAFYKVLYRSRRRDE